MTVEQKQNLGAKLQDLLTELPEYIVDFLTQLSDDTLFTLWKLVNDYMQEKQKNHKPKEDYQ